jgi:hypothetical protein
MLCDEAKLFVHDGEVKSIVNGGYLVLEMNG